MGTWARSTHVRQRLEGMCIKAERADAGRWLAHKKTTGLCLQGRSQSTHRLGTRRVTCFNNASCGDFSWQYLCFAAGKLPVPLRVWLQGHAACTTARQACIPSIATGLHLLLVACKAFSLQEASSAEAKAKCPISQGCLQYRTVSVCIYAQAVSATRIKLRNKQRRMITYGPRMQSISGNGCQYPGLGLIQGIAENWSIIGFGKYSANLLACSLTAPQLLSLSLK